MNWFLALVLFALIWWTVLFAVLPIGTRPQAEADPATGGWRGVPVRPMLWRKALWTTVVTLVIWGGAIWLIQSPYLSFRHGWLASPPD